MHKPIIRGVLPGCAVYVVLGCALYILIFVVVGIAEWCDGNHFLGAALLAAGAVGLVPLFRAAPRRRKPNGLPPRLDLSKRVRDLAADPQRRSEAIQAYRTETGVTSLEAERAIQEWVKRRSE
jgi:hypothetical protein